MEILLLGGIIASLFLFGSKKSTSGSSEENPSDGSSFNDSSGGSNDEFKDIVNPPSNEKPTGMPSDVGYYRLADTSKPYDPFYDYSDKWSSDRLLYTGGKYGLPASGSGHLLRFRLSSNSSFWSKYWTFNVANVNEPLTANHISFLNKFSGYKFYAFQVKIEVFNPFDVDVNIHSFAIPEQKESPAIVFGDGHFYPLPSWRYMSNKTTDRARSLMVLEGNELFNESWAEKKLSILRKPVSQTVLGQNISVLTHISSVTVKARSSEQITLYFATPDPATSGFVNLWAEKDNVVFFKYIASHIFTARFTYKMETSPEVYAASISLKTGTEPKVIPEKWWQIRYLGNNFDPGSIINQPWYPKKVN